MNNKSTKKYLKVLNNSDFFDKKFYSEKYGIEIEKCVEHYYFEGWQKGYDPSLRFSSSKYLDANFAVKICPLLDYELYHKENNREIKATNPVYEGFYYKKQIVRFIKRKISKLINFGKINKNKNKKILVCLHLFYYYSFDEIEEYLKNLESYNYDLVVTITEECFDEELKEKIMNFKSDAKVYKYKNKGYDVGPFVDILNKIDLNKYNMLIKLQSKGTKISTRFVYNQIFRDREWFLDLFEGVLGAFNVHKNIDKICNDKNVGIVAAKNLIINDPKHKKNLIKDCLKEMNLKYIDDYRYVAGTCFCIKPQLLKKLKKMNLTIKDFSDTRRNTFSLAHIIERYMCFEINEKNMSFYGNKVCRFNKIKWKKINKKLYNLSGLRLTENKDFNLSDDFVYYFLEGFFIDNYEVDYIRLDKIRRLWDGKKLKLNQCHPYKYLKGNIKEYQNYCKYHQENNLPYMTLDRFKTLIDTLEKKGYDDNYPIVLDSSDNTVIDGQHRSCYLLYKYGKNYKVKVLKIKYNYLNLRKIKPFSDVIE